MNGTAGGGGGGLAQDEEMPAQHELGEELAFTGRWVVQDCLSPANYTQSRQILAGKVFWLTFDCPKDADAP